MFKGNIQMKSVILSVVVLLALFCGLAFSDDFEDNQILIRLQLGVSIDTINARYSTTTSKTIVPGQTYKVQVANPSLLASTLTAMLADPDLVWSQNSYFNQDPTEGSRRTLAVVDGDPHPSEYFDQNVLKRLKALEAHGYSTGQGVIVAVIDTGVDYNHPDLTNHMLRDAVTNQVIGWDFVDNDADPIDAPDGIDNDNDGLTDEGSGHGTHIAGIIALVAPDAKILPIRVLDTEGSGTADNVAEAIRYVVNYHLNVAPGAKMVINLSLGIPNVTRVEVIHDVIDEEISEHNPPLPISVVASAGNDGLPVVHYPASEGDVLSIAAVDPNDVKADFSNYKDVDVAAPGVGIYSTFLCNPVCSWATWDGTSMAAPFVSGEVALIKAIETGTPRLPNEVENLVEQSVDNVSKLNPGVDIGTGRINLLKAVQAASGLTVKKAVYTVAKQKLVIKAFSNGAPGDVLNVEGFGAMTYDADSNAYFLKVKKLAPMPATVNITSTAFSSSVTVPVKAK